MDGPVSLHPSPSSGLDNLLRSGLRRLDGLLDIGLVRHTTARMAGIASVDSPHSLSASFTGPMLLSSGLAIDARPDCSLYSRSSLSLLASGTVSCSLARLMIRIFKII